jgi:PAS domain S-box-containing protein
MKSPTGFRVDPIALKAIDAFMSVQSLDDLLESALHHLLDISCVRQGEVLLYNTRNDLICVGAARNIDSGDSKQKKIHVESWILESTVRHSTRRNPLPSFFFEYSIPLLTPEKALGVMNVQLDRVMMNDQDISGNLNLIGTQLSAKIKEITLKNQIRGLETERKEHIARDLENQQLNTTLSKELYAICAISTRINQSLNIQKSLRKSIEKIKEVFRASEVLVYLKEPGQPLPRLPTVGAGDEKYTPYILERIEKAVKQDFPPVQQAAEGRDGIPPYCPKRIDLADDPSGSLSLVPMMSKTRLTGVLVILGKSTDGTSGENMRLMAGIANIMGIAVENMYLYRQSQQEKKTAAFLVQTISKFNEKLDLENTLRTIAEKGSEFIREKSLVLLLSETKTPMLHLDYRNPDSTRPGPKIETFSQIQPEGLRFFYDAMASKKRPSLISDIGRSKIVRKAGRTYFIENGIQSILSIPLWFMDKPQGLLILCREAGKRRFNRIDISVAQAIGAAASTALENARSYGASMEMSGFLEKKISQKTHQIRQIQERQNVRIENRKDIIFRVNADYRFVFVNKAMERMSGYTREELYQRDVKVGDVVADEDRDRVHKGFGDILKGGCPIVSDLEYRHVNQKGEDRLVSLTMYPEMDDLGRIVGVEGVGQDITEKKRLEAELNKAKDLALLGEFSGAIAHQIRNPLGNILMGAKLLRKAVGLDEEGWDGHPPDRDAVSEIFNNLSEGIYNLNQVVTELVGYTRTLKLSRSLQRIEVLIQETLAVFGDAIRQKSIQVEQHIAPYIPPLSLDAVLISQAIQNIMHNAIQAMQGGGRLTVAAEPARDNPAHVLISIGDTGPGIEDGLIEKIFNPCFTTKPSGVGLGLSLAHRIISAHMGRIWVCHNPCRHLSGNIRRKPTGFEPAPWEGVTFHILLPADENAARTVPHSFPDSFLKISCG